MDKLTKKLIKDFAERQNRISINEIAPYEHNNKDHPEDQINLLASMITKVWFTMPIVIDDKNIIVSGHWRYLAARNLWLSKVPVIRLADIDEQSIKEYRIFDNRIADMATYNVEHLTNELMLLNNPEVTALFDDMEISTELRTGERKEDWATQANANYDFDNNPIKWIAMFYWYEEYVEVLWLLEQLMWFYDASDMSDLVYKIFVDENN